jgi:phage virion morphogenesis protein
MAVQLHITVQDEKVRALFGQLQKSMGDLTPVMREVGEIVRESVMRNFRESRSPEGVPWKPSRRALLGAGRTLIDTATLRNSIHVRPEKDKVAVGTPVEYGGVHQVGARRGSFGQVIVRVRAHRRVTRTGKESTVRAHTRKAILPWGDIPPRPFLGVRREDWGEIHDALTDYLMGGSR